MILAAATGPISSWLASNGAMRSRLVAQTQLTAGTATFRIAAAADCDEHDRPDPERSFRRLIVSGAD